MRSMPRRERREAATPLRVTDDPNKRRTRLGDRTALPSAQPCGRPTPRIARSVHDPTNAGGEAGSS